MAVALTCAVLTARAEDPPAFQAPPKVGAEPRPPLQQQSWARPPAGLAPQRAAQIADQFRARYRTPLRVLVFVNRVLVDEQSGIRLTGRSENTSTFKRESTVPAAPQSQGSVTVIGGGDVTVGGAGDRGGPGRTSTDTVVAVNTYRVQTKPQQGLEERRFARLVEAAFGKRLRQGGATLADQTVMTQMTAEQPGASQTATEGSQARREREAIRKAADVVLEVIVGSRTVSMVRASGDVNVQVPDIQATAVFLADGRILGEVSTDDAAGVLNVRREQLGSIEPQVLSDAVALALLQDMAADAVGVGK